MPTIMFNTTGAKLVTNSLLVFNCCGVDNNDTFEVIIVAKFE